MLLESDGTYELIQEPDEDFFEAPADVVKMHILFFTFTLIKRCVYA